MLINKLRFNKLNLRVLALSLIKKIPLSDDAKSLGRSIKSLEKSCKQLKEMDLITDFKVIKQGKLIQTEIEFFFEEKHNTLKQNFFFEDKNHFDNLVITYTDKGDMIIPHNEEELLEVQKERENVTPTQEKIEEIFNELPPRARELKTMPGAIKDAIRQYGFENTMYAAKYISSKKITSIRSYFIKTLENGWAEEFMLLEKEKADKAKKKEEQLTLNTMETQISSENKPDTQILEKKSRLYGEYKLLSAKEREEIENIVLNDYMKQCKVFGSSQKKAFQYAKESLIKEYLYKRNAEKAEPEILKPVPEPENMKEIHMLPMNFGNSFNEINHSAEEEYMVNEAEEDNSNIFSDNSVNNQKTNVINSGFNLEKIYNEIEDISFNTENMSNKKIKKSDIICDMKKVYNEVSLFQMELLDVLETLDTIEEGTQNKILRIVGVSKFFEATVGGYYMRIEYIKDKESSIKIIKK